MVVRRAVVQGQAFTPADFQTNVACPRSPRSLPSGLRAVAVPLDRVDSVGALLQPGDWVDVLLSIRGRRRAQPGRAREPGRLPGQHRRLGHAAVLHDRRVREQHDGQGRRPEGPGPCRAAAPGDRWQRSGTPIRARSSRTSSRSWQSRPQQAEVIRFAQLDGHVSLALRSPADYGAGEVTTSGITLQQLVDTYGVLPPAPITAR